MATKKVSRLPGRCALALAIGLAFAAPVVNGASLGRISVQSALGQPLRAEVEITAVSREEAASLAVRLASAAAFQQANLEYNPALSGLRVTLDRRAEDRYVVRISSQTAVSEPYLDLLLELTSSTGRVLREYTILLDPPALRASQEVIAPAAERAPAGTAARGAPAPSRQPAPTASAATPGAPNYTVRRGDTLGGIAEKTRPASASLDQMLLALFRANPGAFIGGNMNNLRADTVLTLPQEQQVLATDPTSARREVLAQSAEFARYRSRLAQAATETAPGAAGAAGQGRITTRVDERPAPAASGDQLKIAQPSPAATAGDEAVARDRQLKDLLDRVAELERANQQLQKNLELQSRAEAQAQATAEGKPAESAAVAQAPATAPAPAATPAASAPAVAPAAPSAPPPATEPPKPAAKAAAPEEPGFLSGLFGTNTPVIAGLGALLAALVGYWAYRRRSGSAKGSYELGDEAVQGNSLFGQTGGRSIDTAATSNFNSSFIPPATQLDSTEVDPVAEADVYIAYGREEQAEDILKEALRIQPDRHAARVKMMELLANRGDKAGFVRHAAELKARTGGAGEDWERAATLGRVLDPAHPLFASTLAAAADAVGRDAATTALGAPTTRSSLGIETGGIVETTSRAGARADAGGRAEHAATLSAAPTTRAPDPSLVSDSLLNASTVLPVETRSTTPGQTLGGNSLPLMEGVPSGLSGLEFETIAPTTQVGQPESTSATASAAPLEYDLRLSPATVGGGRGLPKLPDIDLNLTPAPSAREPAKPEGQRGVGQALDFDLPIERPLTIRDMPARGKPGSAGEPSMPPAPAEDSAFHPTLLGGLTALPEGMTRVAPNTDQATVPLIDFDLTGADLPMSTSPSRSGALTGSPMAAQIATKLDLARGYIDLGVKDGARELLEEVMREGTRDQRQAAVELMKQIDR